MIAAVDVDYRADHALAACVLFARFDDAAPLAELTARVDEVAPYRPGAFYERELPCLRAVLAQVPDALDVVVVVDGHVSLDASGTPGLGARLFTALGGRVAVIGVAKTLFRGAPARPLVRGSGARPLWIDAAGMDVDDAVRAVASMHGAHRIPTLLRRVDALARAGR